MSISEIYPLLVDYFLNFSVFAKEKYKIDPLIFTVLFLSSAIPVYYGYYRIARSFLIIKDKKIKRKKLDQVDLRIGVVIAVIAWWTPYLYVIFFGRLPLREWIYFIVFICIFGMYFMKTILKKTRETKNNLE